MSARTGTSAGGRGKPPRAAEVAARRERMRALVHGEQRLRLQQAMIAAIAENGYRETRVADVLSRAGVSRKTFYEQFENKQECLLETFDQIVEVAVRRVDEAYRAGEGWPGRVEAAIRELFRLALENPGAQRVGMIEIAAAGPVGIERRERSIERYEGFISEALALAPGEGTVSPTVLKAVVGGISWILYRRTQVATTDELLALVPDLVAWATAYYPTPERILAEPGASAAQAPARRRTLIGGRAPGTLAPHPRLRATRGLPRGDQNVSRSFVVHNQRERILDAVANLTAAGGYADLKVEEIVDQAAVSLKAFYEHFSRKEDALLVAFEVGHAKALAMVERAYSEEADWRYGVRVAIATLFDFLASEPAFAHMGLVDALTATTRSAERANVAVSAYAPMLVPGLRERSGAAAPPAIAVEAVASGIFELCLSYVWRGEVQKLPELTVAATYIALAPFLGREEATRVAISEACEP